MYLIFCLLDFSHQFLYQICQKFDGHYLIILFFYLRLKNLKITQEIDESLPVNDEGSVKGKIGGKKDIFKRRKKKVSSKVNLSVPKKPLTAYAIFIKQVKFDAFDSVSQQMYLEEEAIQ